MSCIPTSTRFKSRNCGLCFDPVQTALVEEPYTSRATRDLIAFLTVRTVAGTFRAGSDVSGDGDRDLGGLRAALGSLPMRAAGCRAPCHVRWRHTRRHRWRHKLPNLLQVDFRQGDFPVGETRTAPPGVLWYQPSHPRPPPPLRLLPGVIGDDLCDDLR